VLTQHAEGRNVWWRVSELHTADRRGWVVREPRLGSWCWDCLSGIRYFVLFPSRSLKISLYSIRRLQLPARFLPVHYSLLNQPLDFVLPELLRTLPNFLFSGHRVLPRRYSGRIVLLNTRLHQVSGCEWVGTILPFPLCVCSGKLWMTFTFTESIVKYTKNMQINSINYRGQERYM